MPEEKLPYKDKDGAEHKLTVKQRKFLDAYLETGVVSIAAKRAGYKWDVSGYRGLKKPLLRLAILERMDRAGVNHDKFLNKLAEGMEATKVISAFVVATKSDDPTAKTLKADAKTQDFIEVPDFQVQHQFLKTAMDYREKFENLAEKPTEVASGGLTEFIVIRNVEEKADGTKAGQEIRIEKRAPAAGDGSIKIEGFES